MKKLFLAIMSALFCISLAYGQNALKIDKSKLPKEIKYLGNIVNAITWEDKLGINYVVSTQTNVKQDKEGFKSAELYVYHYILEDGAMKLLWKIYDFNKDCDFDLYLKFIDGTFKVTDLDNNGIAEVWVMYENQCTSDVSPGIMKIIMYEENKKYALRGANRVQVSKTEFTGGQYKLDDYFKNGNPSFRKFAIDLWEKHKLKKW